MNYPNFNEERKLKNKGFRIIVGLDESGRGPLAGPVVACAVSIIRVPGQVRNFCNRKNFGPVPKFFRDSKRLTPKKRKEWYKILTKDPKIKWATARVSEKVIDEINILEATRLAMKKAVLNLSKKLGQRPNFLLIDGNQNLPKIKISQKPIVKADEKVFSCSAASIISKVTRDRIMEKEHKKYPQYNFKQHKGYPTKQHRGLLEKHGACEIHRKSFKPVRLLNNKHQAPNNK